MNIEWVWFDLGNTLVYQKREEALYRVLKNCDIKKNLSDIYLAFHLADKYFMREHKGLLGKSREEFMPHYFKKLIENLQVDIEERNLEQIIKEFCDYKDDCDIKKSCNWHAYSSSINVIRYLKKLNIKVGLISNWDNTGKDVLVKNKLYDLFDEIVISSFVGVVKPDKKIFDLALERGKVSGNKCLYVGDNYYDDAIGCEKVGMKCVIINPYGHYGIEEIKNIDIISNIKDLPKYIKERF